MQCILLFETGEQDDAMKRVHDLIDTVDDKMIFYAVQVCSWRNLRGDQLPISVP